MMKKMRIQYFALILCLVGVVGAATIGEQCAEDFQKVTSCLTYATGKSETPSKDCCSAVGDIRVSRPVCLCYIILQVHNGTNSVKNMGIQESRLLQLPSACKLANASISDCPKLLNIPSTSPDYAIFTNASTSIVPSTTTGTSTPAKNDSSNGVKLRYKFAGFMAFSIALFFYAF